MKDSVRADQPLAAFLASSPIVDRHLDLEATTTLLRDPMLTRLDLHHLHISLTHAATPAKHTVSNFPPEDER